MQFGSQRQDQEMHKTRQKSLWQFDHQFILFASKSPFVLLKMTKGT